MKTNSLSAKDIKRGWHLIDAQDQILGRLATSVAKFLLGKHKANFVPYLDLGDFVVVINASKIKVTGKKENTKEYFRHSGFPGGDRREILATLRIKKPEFIIKHAVSGMMPKTKLGKESLKKLHIYCGEEHPYEERF